MTAAPLLRTVDSYQREEAMPYGWMALGCLVLAMLVDRAPGAGNEATLMVLTLFGFAAFFGLCFLMPGKSELPPLPPLPPEDDMQLDDGERLAKQLPGDLSHSPSYNYFLYRILHENRLFRDPDAMQVIRRFHERFYRMLPPLPNEPSIATVPLSSLIDVDAFLHLVLMEFSEERNGKPLFDYTVRDLRNNLLRSNGFDPTLSNPKNTRLKLTPEFIRGTAFMPLLQADLSFPIPDKYWKEHCFIAGATGTGKTQTLQYFITRFLPRTDVALFVIDSMGAMLKKLAPIVPKERLVVLNPAGNPPQLNFFKLNASPSLYFYLFKAIDQTLTQRQATMIAYLVALMQKVPGANLDTLRDFCERKDNPYPEAIAQLQPIEQDFFTKQFFGGDSFVRQTKQQIAQRLYTIGRLGTFNQMFNAPVNEFDARRCIEEKKIVLVNSDAYNLDEASPVFGRFIIASCMAAARSRTDIPPEQRHLALMFVDEARAYMDETTQSILETARQYGLSLTQATQHMDQLPDGVRRSVLANTTIKLASGVSYSDAVVLSRDMNTTPDFIRGMKSYDRSRVEWACHVRNYTDKAIKLTVPMGVLENISSPYQAPAQSAATVPPDAAPPTYEPLPPNPSPQPTTQEIADRLKTTRDDVQNTPIPPTINKHLDPEPPDPPPVASKFKPGDRIQATINGADQFPDGAIVFKVVHTYVFVEGSLTGIPEKDCRFFEPATKRPQAEHPSASQNQSTRDPDTDYDTMA